MPSHKKEMPLWTFFAAPKSMQNTSKHRLFDAKQCPFYAKNRAIYGLSAVFLGTKIPHQ